MYCIFSHVTYKHYTTIHSTEWSYTSNTYRALHVPSIKVKPISIRPHSVPVSVARMSCISELLSQLTCFLKPMMDRAVEDPLYRMHHGRNTFSLEINWAFTNTSGNFEKKKKSSTFTPVTGEIQDGCRSSRRNLERNRRRRQRRKAARALHRTPTAKSPPIIVSPDVTPPAKTPPTTSRRCIRGHLGPCLLGT